MEKPKSVKRSISNPIAQKSRAIYDSAIKKPAIRSVSLARKVGKSMDIARSKNITKFTHRNPNTNVTKKPANKSMDIGPTAHPMAIRARMMQSLKKASLEKPKPLSLKETKEKAINEALAKTTNKEIKKVFMKRHFKLINISTISLGIVIIIGCLIYLNMPVISVKVASMQAGINASYPKYSPDGYKLDGPVIFNSGEVVVNYKGNTNDWKYSIKQSKSSWDSSAVKNKVEEDSGGEFITIQEKGLTIYTYNGNAAWVNGGILYTVEGNAPLSGDQIRRIATSL